MQDNYLLSGVENIDRILGVTQMKEIDSLLKISEKQIKEKTQVIYLYNKKADNLSDDYRDFSVLSEYLDLAEIGEIANSIISAGFSLHEFNNELDFINYVIKNKTEFDKNKYIIVNNIQTGTKIGRKSLIPAFCDMINIPYTNSNPYVVSLCRNKYHCNCILENHNLPVPKTWLLTRKKKWLNKETPLDLKVLLKPNCESSSIGIDDTNISKFSNDILSKAFKMCKEFRQDIIAQEFISGYEVEVPLIYFHQPISLKTVGIEIDNEAYLGNKILTNRIRSIDEYNFFDFSNIYNDISKVIRKTAEKAAEILGITGFGRIDFRVKTNGDIYITDISTNPHIHKLSSFYYAFNSLGYNYQDMIKCLIAIALKN